MMRFVGEVARGGWEGSSGRHFHKFAWFAAEWGEVRVVVVFTGGRAGRGLTGISGFGFCVAGCRLPVAFVDSSFSVFSNLTPYLRAEGVCLGGD